jgi:hypothetical protein
MGCNFMMEEKGTLASIIRYCHLLWYNSSSVVWNHGLIDVSKCWSVAAWKLTRQAYGLQVRGKKKSERKLLWAILLGGDWP